MGLQGTYDGETNLVILFEWLAYFQPTPSTEGYIPSNPQQCIPMMVEIYTWHPHYIPLYYHLSLSLSPLHSRNIPIFGG